MNIVFVLIAIIILSSILVFLISRSMKMDAINKSERDTKGPEVVLEDRSIGVEDGFKFGFGFGFGVFVSSLTIGLFSFLVFGSLISSLTQLSF